VENKCWGICAGGLEYKIWTGIRYSKEIAKGVGVTDTLENVINGP
jgi:hypothetical protein